MSLLALVASLAGFAEHSIIRARTVTQLVAVPLHPAAGDCPTAVVCSAGAPRARVLAAMQQSFPRGRPVDASAIVQSDTGHPYREDVRRLTATGVAVEETARCLAGGAPVAARSPGSTASLGPTTIVIVVPGATGCSVAVIVTVPAGVPVPLSQARVLADDPNLQLTP